MQLQNKVALITGAGSGIGEAAARMLAGEGAAIGALDRDADQVRQAVEDINREGGRAVALAADVSSPQQVEAAVKKLVDTWGRLDIVFANAGVNGVWAPLEDLKPEEWDSTLAINLKGTFLTVKYAVPHLKKQGGSIIITK